MVLLVPPEELGLLATLWAQGNTNTGAAAEAPLQLLNASVAEALASFAAASSLASYRLVGGQQVGLQPGGDAASAAAALLAALRPYWASASQGAAADPWDGVAGVAALSFHTLSWCRLAGRNVTVATQPPPGTSAEAAAAAMQHQHRIAGLALPYELRLVKPQGDGSDSEPELMAKPNLVTPSSPGPPVAPPAPSSREPAPAAQPSPQQLPESVPSPFSGQQPPQRPTVLAGDDAAPASRSASLAVVLGAGLGVGAVCVAGACAGVLLLLQRRRRRRSGACDGADASPAEEKVDSVQGGCISTAAADKCCHSDGQDAADSPSSGIQSATPGHADSAASTRSDTAPSGRATHAFLPKLLKSSLAQLHQEVDSVASSVATVGPWAYGSADGVATPKVRGAAMIMLPTATEAEHGATTSSENSAGKHGNSNTSSSYSLLLQTPACAPSDSAGGTGTMPGSPGVGQLATGPANALKGSALVLLRELGRGAQGVVYAGRWRGLDVAAKHVLFSVHSEAAQPPGAAPAAAQLAVREAAISASVSHPHVVATYAHSLERLDEAGQQRQAKGGGGGEAEAWKLTLVQELCDGGSLRECLASRRLAGCRVREVVAGGCLQGAGRSGAGSAGADLAGSGGSELLGASVPLPTAEQLDAFPQTADTSQGCHWAGSPGPAPVAGRLGSLDAGGRGAVSNDSRATEADQPPTSEAGRVGDGLDGGEEAAVQAREAAAQEAPGGVAPAAGPCAGGAPSSPPPALHPLLAALMALQAARGVAHLHARGIVHCDISSANVVLKSEEPLPTAAHGSVRVGGVRLSYGYVAKVRHT